MLAIISALTESALAIPAFTGLLAAASWGLGCLMFDRAHSHPVSSARPPSAAGMNLFKNGLATVCFVLVAAIMGSTYPAPDSFWPLFWSGVIGFAIGDSLYFAAFPLAGVQVTAMMGNLMAPIAGLIAWTFLDESFEAQSFLWMAVVLGGVSLVILDPAKRQKSEPRRPRKQLFTGLLFAFGAAVCQGAAIVIAHSSFEGVAILPGTTVRLVGGLAAALVIAGLVSLLPSGRSSGVGLAETLRPIRSVTLMRALLIPTFFATLVSLPLHSATVQVAPGHLSALILSTSPLFILPLGFKFGVRQGPISVLGTLIGFGGVAGLIWMG